MKTWLMRLAVAACLAWAGGAHAITCTSIMSPGFSTTYFSRTTRMVQGTFTVTCDRGNGDADTTVTYGVVVNNGLNAQNQNNQASLGNDRVAYELYTGSTCQVPWTGTTAISDSMTWDWNRKGSQTKQTSFWACLPSQTVTGAGGAYQDTVQMTLSPVGGASITGNMPVEIYAPANCSFSTLPGAINLSYTAFGPSKSASTFFSVLCTSGMPYTVTTNVAEGVLVNLRYLLAASPESANGTGAAQRHEITATIPPGQGGACSTGACSASQTHTVLITY